MAGNEVEKIKDDSRGLRGTLRQTLAADVEHFSHEEYQLLKFHGTYQQDDRDKRAEAKRAGKEKAWAFMVRTKTPGGAMTARQYIAMDDIAGKLGNGTLRITTRQGIQFHGIVKKGLKQCMMDINAAGITTWGACGDVVRNTMGPSSPLATPAHRETQRLAQEISDTFLSKSHAYAEIWLDGKCLNEQAPAEDEPIYGKVYLPRKFKIAIAIPPRNDVDVYSNDLAFVAQVNAAGEVEGYTVLAGGGFGMSHGQIKTHPVLAVPLGYVRKEHAVEAAMAVVTAQRDHGNREDRKLSRLKYLIENKGIEWFRDEVRKRMKAPLEPAKAFQFNTVSDMLGWHEQGDGKWFVGVWVSQGRVKDEGKVKYRTAFRKISEKLDAPIRFTPNCNIIFWDMDAAKKAAAEQILRECGVPSTEGFTEARKTSHACVALPTCGLALAESERALPGVMDEIDKILRDLKLEKEQILIRMSGCPNGCSRPYNADIAFVGRAPEKYALFVGGSHLGDRLAGLETKMVETKNIPGKIRSILEDYVKNRKPNESFTAYWGRARPQGPRPEPEQFHVELAERAARLAGQAQNPVAVE